MVSGMPGQIETENVVAAAENNISSDPAELIALGKRHMLLDEYSQAVEYFAKACQLLADKHGDLGKECAPAYLLYGRCLLEMARQNLGVVEPESAKAKGGEADDKKDEAGSSGEKMEEIPEGEEDGEGEGEDEDGEDDGQEKGEENEDNSEDAQEEGDEKPKADGENGEGEEEEEEEDEDDADSYLKLAWTFLDLAKVIFLKEKSIEGDFAAADCLMALGEVSMEGGNCDAGAKDMKEAIHIRRLHSGRVDRIVAGSEYELGAALHQFQRYEEALESLKECLSILTELNDKVSEKLKAVTDKEEEDNLQTSAKEFAELINDVKDKIAEVEEERSMRDVVKNELAEKAKAAGVDAPAEMTTNGSGATGEVKTLTARRKPTSDSTASPARIASALLSSLASAAENIDSPATKSKVAALISMQLKRHRLDSPGATNGNGEPAQAVKRPASSNSTENDGGSGDIDEDGITSKRIRAEQSDTAANN